MIKTLIYTLSWKDCLHKETGKLQEVKGQWQGTQNGSLDRAPMSGSIATKGSTLRLYRLFKQSGCTIIKWMSKRRRGEKSTPTHTAQAEACA
jgi:hypothetical protein